MSQRNGFTSGFLLGSIVGGIVGGVIGALVASGHKQEPEAKDTDENLEGEEVQLLKSKKRDKMETARRSLEDKISQLNSAIDEVRSSIGKEE